MNIDLMKQIVQAGRHLKNNARTYSSEDNSDKISIYIDLIKYGQNLSAHRSLESGFAESFCSLPVEERATLALMDSEHVLTAALLNQLLEQGYTQWLNSPCITLKEMALAIAIASENTTILTNADTSLLYQYFINARLNEKDLIHFSKENFIEFALNKVLHEERVIFIWIVQNITTMIKTGFLQPEQHKDFFKKLFEKYDYIQGEQENLFFEAVSRHTPLFNELTAIRLSIDPFTKQVNYSLWLRDSSKFLFLERLRQLEGVAATTQASSFDHRLQTFMDLNKFDNSLRRALAI